MSKHIEVPVTYVTTREHGVHGRFRYDEHHLTTIDGQQSIYPGVVPEDSVEARGSILLPNEKALSILGGYATKLAKGATQDGLYDGKREPDYNCASFVHDLTDVDFDRRRIGQPDGVGSWEEVAMDPSWRPAAGEVVAYRHANGNWTHWAIGAGDLGVMGIAGANGHLLSIAQSPDYAKGFGHTTPHLAAPSTRLVA